MKEQGPRALWDNLDDIILLVIELQEVSHTAIITLPIETSAFYIFHMALVVTVLRLYMIVVVILD